MTAYKSMSILDLDSQLSCKQWPFFAHSLHDTWGLWKYLIGVGIFMELQAGRVKAWVSNGLSRTESIADQPAWKTESAGCHLKWARVTGEIIWLSRCCYALQCRLWPHGLELGSLAQLLISLTALLLDPPFPWGRNCGYIWATKVWARVWMPGGGTHTRQHDYCVFQDRCPHLVFVCVCVLP